jgi:hypothetical protein
MPKTEVTQALQWYLTPENSGITYLGAVYPALPKVSNEADLFNFVPDGTGVGALIYLFCDHQQEQRIALAGQHNGRKLRTYNFTFLCILKSDLEQASDGQAAFNVFMDSLIAYIQADRNAGTESPLVGGKGPYAGSGVVFQMGEGGINEGVDIEVDYPVPKTADGGVMLFQSVLRLIVLETMNT